MIKYLKNRKAQAVMGEFMVVIFFVLAATVGMSIFFKRAVQARIHDARNYMVNEVRIRTEGEFDGDLYYEYEPYYSNVAAFVFKDAKHDTQILPGGSSGIYQKTIDETTRVWSNSQTFPPGDFERTLPGG